jgi:integrase
MGAARWADISLEASAWTIPTTKNGEPHTVPLSRQARELLQERKPAKVKPSDLVFANSEGGALHNWDRETKRIMAACGVTGWTRHDLRRTGASTLGEMGVLPDLIEAALNHVSIRSQLAATYNRSRYRPQVAEALQRLADRLDEIETGHAGSGVEESPATD